MASIEWVERSANLVTLQGLLSALLIVGGLLLLIGELWIALPFATGHDYSLYMGAARSWVTGGGFYHSYQLTGPYAIVDSEILYPPLSLWLLVPFMVLPPVLWWAIPLGAIAWCVLSWRPASAAVGISLLLVCLPVGVAHFGLGLELVTTGNPGMWCAAFVAVGLRAGWAGPLVLIKPTLAPFAFVGLRRHPAAWLVGMALVALGSLAVFPLWPDYVRALLNVQGGRDIWYTLGNWPAMLSQIVLWAGRRHVPAGRGNSSAARRMPEGGECLEPPEARQEGRRPEGLRL